jgi:glucosamine kinase
MLYLGIDGGATAAKWSIQNENGVFASGKSLALDGHMYRSESQERMHAVFAEIAGEVEAGKVLHIYAGLTGLSEDQSDKALIASIAQKYFPNARVTLAQDIELAYRAHYVSEGILLYAGTGSIAISMGSDGKWNRVGGWGYLLGDEGAGYWIGREAIRHTVLNLELHQTDPLSAAISQSLNASSWGEIRTFVYGKERSHIAALSHVVHELASQGNVTAELILADAAEHLSELISRMDRILGDTSHPIVITGGVAQKIPLIFQTLKGIYGNRISMGDKDIAQEASRLARDLG